MVLVTHDQQHAPLAVDHVLVMDAGWPPRQGLRALSSNVPTRCSPPSSGGSPACGRSDRASRRLFCGMPGTGPAVRGSLRSVPAHPQAAPGHSATVLLRPHALQVERAPQAVADDPGAGCRPRSESWRRPHYYGDRVEYLVETEVFGAGGRWRQTSSSLAPPSGSCWTRIGLVLLPVLRLLPGVTVGHDRRRIPG